jgi:hypothetical protein
VVRAAQPNSGTGMRSRSKNIYRSTAERSMWGCSSRLLGIDRLIQLHKPALAVDNRSD